MDTVTIVIPVYNAEAYIEKCIKSVIAQTYGNWELILVDDGSTDRSSTICDGYVKTDVRIKVYHNKNCGVSSARNYGIDHSSGKWITFLDSDDYYDPTFLEGLMPKEQNADFVVGGFRWVGDYDVKHYITRSRVIEKKDEIGELLNFKYGDDDEKSIFLYPWGKLYRTDIIKGHNILFNEQMKVGEDFCFVLLYAAFVKNIYLTCSNHYNYLVIKGRQNYMLNANELLFHISGFYNAVECLENTIGDRVEVTRQFMERTYLNMFLKRLKRSTDYQTYKKELIEYKKCAFLFNNYISSESFIEKLKIWIPLYLPMVYYFTLKKE